jgi:dUTP pyrophosphatase
MDYVFLKIMRVRPDQDDDLDLPRYMSENASGMDVCAGVEAPVTLAPGQRLAVPTGFALEVPDGAEVQVRPRSGLALKHGVTVLNAPGTIDADYRGEVQVILANLGPEPFVINRGDRIAQLVVCPVLHAELSERKSLSPSKRGAGGFGSSGR